MFFIVYRDEAHARLRAAGYARTQDTHPGNEVWVNRFGFEINLEPEHFGDYPEEGINRAETMANHRPD